MKTKPVTLAELIAEAMVRAENHAESTLSFASIGNKSMVTPQITMLAKSQAEAGAKIAAELFAAELREILFAHRPFKAETPKALAALAGTTPEDVEQNRRIRTYALRSAHAARNA